MMRRRCYRWERVAAIVIGRYRTLLLAVLEVESCPSIRPRPRITASLWLPHVVVAVVIQLGFGFGLLCRCL